MASEYEARSSKPENQMLVGLFRLAVPALLGAILTYAASISTAQTEQSKALYGMQGQLATIVQQNTDYGSRLAKVERAVEDNRRSIADQNSRLSVVEDRRIK